MSAWQDAARHRARRGEIELVLEELGVFKPRFARVLEIGSGEGFSASYLSRLGSVFLSDLRVPAKWYSRSEQFVICDAGSLPYPDKAFDLIFSSHVVEHISSKPKALAEMLRVTTDDAMLVHVVPTPFWKLMSVMTYYPDQALAVFKRVVKWFGRSGANRCEVPRSVKNPIRPTRLIPPVHGTNTSTWDEFREFHPAVWKGIFEAAGFACVRSLPLLAYAPANLPILPANRRLVRIGLFSSVAFFLRKSQNGEGGKGQSR